MHALLPRLISKAGHIFHYHIAVQEAIESMEWRYFAYAPQKTSISPLPHHWQAVLANDISESPKNLTQKLRIFFANILPFRRIFQKIENHGSAVVFIEHFELQHLATIAVALFFLKPKFHFWILHRYELEGRRLKAALCRIFLSWLYWKLGRDNVRCLTDSDLLAEVLEVDLKCPVFVLPIPHTEGRLRGKEKRAEGGQFWWWPGGLIREDKGMHKIHQILGLLEGQEAIRLVAAEKAKEVFGDRLNVRFVPTILSREAYVEWMQKADLVLLPYLGKDYSRRTSGIFVEAVTLGAIPVTTKGTWMAHELEKFHLAELVFDWRESDLLERLSSLTNNQSVREKLEIMRSKYCDFHCQNGFAMALQNL